MSETIKHYKFRIILKAFDSRTLNKTSKQIIESIQENDCNIVGPIRIPTKTKRFCVLRSPHVDKDSREHFEIKFFKQIVDIYTKSSLVIDNLMRLSLPAGTLITVQRSEKILLS